MPCNICPKGYRGALPCPACTCELPVSSCSNEGLLPCWGCAQPCRFAERSADIWSANERGRWWDGQDRDEEWGAPPAVAPPAVEPQWIEEQEEDEYEEDLDFDERKLNASTTHLEGLNPNQHEVAIHVNGPCVVIAGAGSGKTKSVIARIQNLIRVERVNPNEILAITFTRKAAHEMRERAVKALGSEEAKGLQIRTFHSVGVRICRANAEFIGIRQRFSLWDDEASKRQMKVCSQEVYEEKNNTRKRSYTTKMCIDTLGQWKEEGKELDDQFWGMFKEKDIKRVWIEAGCADQVKAMQDKDPDGLEEDLREMSEVIERYEDLKRVSNALDLSDLIWLPVIKARKDERIQKALAQRWSHIIVDEYQDTNDIQEELISRLGAETRNVMVVGDDDQSIYGWRGSNVNLITQFTKRWTGSKMIKLGQNYRCRPEIVESARASIKNNKNRVEKDLWSEREKGGSVRTHASMSPWDECAYIVRSVSAKIQSGVKPSEIAILSRRRMGVSNIAAEMLKAKIAHEAVGVREWYRQTDVGIILSHLRYQQNPTDMDAAQEIMSNWPSLGAQTIKAWFGEVQPGSGEPLLDKPLEKVLFLPRSGIKTKKGQSIDLLRQMHMNLTKNIESMSAKEICQEIAKKTGILQEIAEGIKDDKNKSSESEKRMNAINTLMECAEKSKENGVIGIQEMMDEISTLISMQETATDRVSISTIHAAKGLEWEHVIVMGMNQEMFPTGDNIEEERRLFYVACTRAKENLILTWSIRIMGQNGELQMGTKSMFLEESEKAEVFQ